MSGVYWAAAALALLGKLDALDPELVPWIVSCQHENGVRIQLDSFEVETSSQGDSEATLVMTHICCTPPVLCR